MAHTSVVSRADVYISADVETDGPIPGPYSMLSFALTVVGRYDGRSFDRLPNRSSVFSRSLRPISDSYEPEALAVNGLDRDELAVSGTAPERAMDEASAWIQEVAGPDRPVLVAYPLAFDWSFLYWYFERYAADGSPFGHSSCLDIKTFFLATSGAVFDQADKARMPAFLHAEAPHTHDPLDDAVEQGELFANILEWALRRRRQSRGPASTAPEWLAQRVVPIV
jgi:hypothetical protein